MSGRAIGDKRLGAGRRFADQPGETFSIWVFSRSRRRGIELGSIATTSRLSGPQDVALAELHVDACRSSHAGDLDHHVDDVRRERADLPVGAAQADLHRLDRIEDDQAAGRVVGHRGVDELLADPLALHERGREPDGDRREDGEQAQPPGARLPVGSSTPPREESRIGDEMEVEPRGRAATCRDCARARPPTASEISPRLLGDDEGERVGLLADPERGAVARAVLLGQLGIGGQRQKAGCRRDALRLDDRSRRRGAGRPG